MTEAATTNPAMWLSWSLCLLALGAAWAYYRSSVIYLTRQRLFIERKRVFLFFAERGELQSKAHQDLREHINFFVLECHSFGLLFFMAVATLREFKKQRGMEVSKDRASAAVEAAADPATRELLSSAYRKTSELILAGMMLRAVPFWPLFLFAYFLLVLTQRVARAGAWARQTVQWSSNAMSLPSGVATAP